MKSVKEGTKARSRKRTVGLPFNIDITEGKPRVQTVLEVEGQREREKEGGEGDRAFFKLYFFCTSEERKKRWDNEIQVKYSAGEGREWCG